MNPIDNPYTPNAGRKPMAFVGRDKIMTDVDNALQRLQRGGSSQNHMLVGLRGVGKTVLLSHLSRKAKERGFLTIELEIMESGQSLPDVLVPELRAKLFQLNKVDAAKAAVQRAFQALAGFLKHVKFTYQDWEIEPLAGVADSGQLDYDLKELLLAVGEAAQAANTVLVLFIDELHAASKNELTAIIHALHKCAQESLPISLIGAGLPQLRTIAAEAKSYTERMFLYVTIDALDETAAAQALVEPATTHGVEYDEQAVRAVFAETRGYPYFIQEWGSMLWDCTEQPPIRAEHVQQSKAQVEAKLDDSFYRVRFDRLTEQEKRYMHAMAKLGDHSSYKTRDIATQLNKTPQQISGLRDSLIRKGMIHAPHYGEVAFTVPLFGSYLLRELGRD